ncbi:Zinc finger and SCAN domain-containing protein 9 [Orchesella cincta]|uniref:Zinc finger and SCAN domain-containing protein 9 n=1 Tax=Orchesella cincta TaxID=48709 RepID=A0A1D2M2S2_ORCCI|nr:Zinc finger and SCAN domain-containing protein 9 [Orchesella cincta]
MSDTACLVCLKTVQSFDGESLQVDKTDTPILTKFLKLSWELEQLGKLMKNAKCSTDKQSELENVQLLTRQLGMDSVGQLEEFRNALARKCHVRRQELLPDVVVGPRIKVEASALTKVESWYDDHYDLEDQDSLESGADDVDPLDLQGSTDSRERGEDTNMKVLHLIKLEPFHHQDDSESICDNEVDERVDDSFVQPVLLSPPSASNHPSTKKSNDFKHKCPKCRHTFPSEKSVKVHHRARHEPVICNKCGKTMASYYCYRKHFHRYHIQVGKHHCRICSKVFETPYKLMEHNRSHHTKNHHCSYCNFSCSKKFWLAEHIASKHKPERHPCPHCSKVLRTRCYLKGHIRSVHSSKLPSSRNTSVT